MANEGAGMEVHQTRKEGIIIIDPGRRNPWWRGGRRRRHFHFHPHFHFHLRSWKVKVNVLLHKLSVLLRFCCQCLIRPHGESTRKINVQNFKSLYKQLRPGAKIIILRGITHSHFLPQLAPAYSNSVFCFHINIIQAYKVMF